jgi:DNA-binding IclR family transcriptional regulator
VGKKEREWVSVQALLKAMSILTAFTPEAPQLGISELSRRLGMPTSTVQRLLATLAERQFVEQDPGTAKFQLGPALLRLSNVAMGSLDLRKAAMPSMQATRDDLNELVLLCVRRGWERVMLERCDPFHDLRLVTELGQPVPLHIGASSRVLLAYLPPDELEEYLQRPLTARTPNTPVDLVQLRSLLAEIRSRGYAVANSESMSHVISFAAPIRDHWGEVVASVAVTAPLSRFNPRQHSDYAERIMATAHQISTRLGFAAETDH